MASNKKKRIVIIEDEKTFATFLETALSEAGYETFVVSNVAHVFKVVKEIMPDLILLDIVLPAGDGFLIKDKLNQDPSTVGIPVIFVTVKQEIPEKVKGFHLGADDYIVKPFNVDELLARVGARLSKKVFYEKISMTDGLTGLQNTRFFKNQFTLFFKTAKRYKKVFSLAIVDIDKLKHINDTYGHAAGDFILQTFASIAKKVFREADIVTRYGGDEFAIIMPETDTKQATNAMQRLNNAIRGKTFVFQDTKTKIEFSISVGIVTYDVKLKNESEMFRLADENLYKVKAKMKQA